MENRKMVPKKLISIRVEPGTEAKITELMKLDDKTQAAVIAAAVDRYHALRMREPWQAFSTLLRQYPDLIFEGEGLTYTFELADDGSIVNFQMLKSGSDKVIQHRAGENE